MSDNKINDNPDPLSGVTGDRVLKELIIPLKERTGSMIGWGIFCIVLGVLGLIYPFAFASFVTIFLGAMLFVSGISGIVIFWRAHGWKPRTGSILLAILTTICGLLFMLYPVPTDETLVLFLASYFIAAGLVKAWIAFTNMKAKHWGLLLLSAIISIILGGCLWWGWPLTAPYIFGVFIAIELIFDGWTVVLVGMKVRQFNKDQASIVVTETVGPATAAAAAAPTAPVAPAAPQAPQAPQVPQTPTTGSTPTTPPTNPPTA